MPETISNQMQHKKPLHVHFTAEAWAKQSALLGHFNTEVGWHGAVRPLPDGGYEVYDIFVYPQEVTGGSVEVDWGGYDEWLMEHSDFEAIRYQAHSHVDFGPYPSSVDLASEKNRMVPDNEVYLFFIFNKDFYYTCRIYDHGTIRQQDEVNLTYDLPMTKFLADSDKMVKVVHPPVIHMTNKQEVIVHESE